MPTKLEVLLPTDLATPNPSIEEMMVLDTLVNGDTNAAQDEILSRLRALLNLAITARNTKRGWTGTKAIPLIASPNRDIDLAPKVLNDTYIGKVLVKISVQTKACGSGAFKNVCTVTIASIDAAIKTSQQVRVNWEFAEAVRLCLFPFLTGCTNSEGITCWRALEPTGVTPLEGDWAKNYSGTQTTFLLTQTPGV